MKSGKINIIIDFFLQTFLLALGSALCALAVNGILIPYHFISSGFTGFSLILYYLFPMMSVGLIYLLINIPIFILGWRFVGLRFVFYTVLGIVIYSTALNSIEFKIQIQDKLLAAIIAGGIAGIGTGILLRSKGSSGGSEIMCIIFYKLFSFTLGTGSLIINSLVMIISFLFFPLENILYTIVFIVVSAKATDFLFHGLSVRQTVIIISDYWKEILEDLTNKIHIGVTLIDGKGAYKGTDKTILFSVIHRNKVYLLKKAVISRDPHAFISIIESSDVTGLNIGNQPKW